ncbi:MAG: hypothetical protein M3414_03330 [Pseudomonadota bacterium]|nr:hypothetical protein [Pseudomonadota bacterium]
MRVTLAIVIVMKAWQSIVAPLHDVLRNSGEIVAWKSAMRASIAGEPRAWRSVHAAVSLILEAGVMSGIVPDTFSS